MFYNVKAKYMLTRLVGLGLAGLLLIGCSNVHETTLPNGLKVIVKEDHRAPVVVSQIWYKVGSSYEPEGLTGGSHVLEHMMFKGTKRHGPGELSRIIAENGGRENAFTGSDYTAYFQQLEKSRLPIAFELEADRMENLIIDEKEFRKEMRVVMEERRLRTDDSPEGRVHEEFMATAYKVHPYGRPIIGWWRDLENMTAEDVKNWYDRWYAPDNATLVVAGDVHPREVFALAQKYFGPIKSRSIKRSKPPEEPVQTATRRTQVAAPAEVPYLILGYHVPVYGHHRASWEPYALSVLAGVLDGGRSARFPRDLIRKRRIAATLDTGYSAVSRSPTMLVFDGRPAQGHTLDELEQAVRTEIERLKEELVSEQELDRVKAQVVAADVYSRDSIFYQAMRIGMLETTGRDWRLIDDYVDRIQAVTAVQVRQVAQRYLVDTNLTVAVLEPLPISQRPQRSRAASGGRHVN